jgi:hypothetical protein
MTVPAQHSGWWRGRSAPLLGSLLVLALLLPVGVLFLERWGGVADQKAFAAAERDGLAYLTALSQVTLALTDAQSAAVQGTAAPAEQLADALAATSAIDDRVGEQLRVSERWTELREQIERLAAAPPREPRGAYEAYRQTTDLLLDLHTKLRETSGLIQDPDTDVYYLQDAAAEELPEAIIAAGRLADLVHIAGQGPDSDQAGENAEISVARVGVISPTEDLTVDLQAALDSTASRTLSVNVLRQLDEYLQHKDALLAAVPADGRVAGVDLGEVAAARAALHAAAADLLETLLVEMDELIAARVDDLTGSQRTALLALLAAILLAAGLLGLQLAALRRSVRREQPRRGGSATPESAPPGQPDRTPATVGVPEPARAR